MEAVSSTEPGVVELTIVIDATEHVITGARDTSVLESMRDAGLDPPSSCEAGQCGTCLALLTSGSVEMENTTALSDADIADNLILACQARPMSARVGIDFDDI